MKSHLLIALILGIAFFSCEDNQNPTNSASSEPAIIYKSDKLFFSTFPQSQESVKFLFFPNEEFQASNQLFLLSQKGDTLAKVPLSSSEFHKNKLVSELNYDFQEGESYQLRVSQTINKDTVFMHQLPDYRHIFKSGLSKNPIAKFEALPNFDFSPDRKYLFFNDFKDNVQSNYRLELNTGTLFKLEDKLGLKLRAIDKNKLLHVMDGIFESEIFLYDVEKNTSVPFGITSGNRGVMTRVSKNHIVFSNPIKNGLQTLTLVNLETDERRVLPDLSNGHSIREHIIGQMIFGNTLLDIESGTLSEELSPFAGTSLLQYIPDNELIFFMQGLDPKLSSEGFSSTFIVSKKGEQPSFDSGAKKYVNYYLPSETRIKNNKFLIYVDYGPIKDEHRVRGFYQVDLASGTMKLVHSENRFDVFPSALIQLEDNAWLAIFSGEISIYRMD